MTERTNEAAGQLAVGILTSGGETCVDCLVVTELWVRGWDGRVRCMEHAPNGALGQLARHCPTCTCINRPATQEPGA